MKKLFLGLVLILVSTLNLEANNELECTNTYRQVIKCHCVFEITLFNFTIIRTEYYANSDADGNCGTSCAPALCPPNRWELLPLVSNLPIPDKIALENVDLIGKKLLFFSQTNNLASIHVYGTIQTPALIEGYPNITILEGNYFPNEAGIIEIPFE